MSKDTILMVAAALLALLWMTQRFKRKPSFREAVNRISAEGIFYYSERPDLAEGYAFPPEAKLVTAQFINQGLSVIYWRTLKLGSILETMDILFTDRAISSSQKITLHFVDGKATGRRLYFSNQVVPLSSSDEWQANELLRQVRCGLPGYCNNQECPEFG